ncbi:hypothetical protein [Arenicella xantha]|uniref:Sulfotransferase family protein n=1 Tax=Arenicella xantha TaxID=644221 RepID=A0A395JR73_9GAMM|nr:hypothetical protein [Arenicella xantha]RBP52956.1 hypothetical protein DFR28_101340 [Arenicella xantha]
MKTIVHIGQHRTGTTSLQYFLRDNKKRLLKKGLYVPSKVAGHTHKSHYVLNLYALADNRYSPKKDEIIAARGHAYLNKLKIDIRTGIEKVYRQALARKCTTVLWSNEGLYLLNSVSEYESLKGLFSQYSDQVQVVCCFRDVESFKNSYAQHLTLQGITFSEQLDSYRYVESDSWLFDYERKRALLSIVFDHCVYFQYDSGDNLKVFMQSIGYGDIDCDGYRLNTSTN